MAVTCRRGIAPSSGAGSSGCMRCICRRRSLLGTTQSSAHPCYCLLPIVLLLSPILSCVVLTALWRCSSLASSGGSGGSGGPATKISGFLSTCQDLLDTTFFGSVDPLRRIRSSQARRIDSTSGDSMKILILLLSFVATTVAFSPPPMTAHHAAHAVC